MIPFLAPELPDESMVGQYYIPLHDKDTLCVVGSTDSPKLAGTHELLPEIVKIHSPPFTRKVNRAPKGQTPVWIQVPMVFVTNRRGEVLITMWDAEQVFGSDIAGWDKAIAFRNRLFEELKQDHFDSLSEEEQQAHLRLLRAQQLSREQSQKRDLMANAIQNKGFNPLKLPR